MVERQVQSVFTFNSRDYPLDRSNNWNESKYLKLIKCKFRFLGVAREFCRKGEMEEIINYIEKNEKKFVERLREHVEIPSVSGWATHRNECIRQMEVTDAMLKVSFPI